LPNANQKGLTVNCQNRINERDFSIGDSGTSLIIFIHLFWYIRLDKNKTNISRNKKGTDPKMFQKLELKPRFPQYFDTLGDFW